MATTGGASRPSAVVLCSAVLLAFLLAATTSPAGASQLNLYKGKWCTGSFTACWDRQCCEVPGDAVSYRFYYNPDWKAYLYADAGCSSSANSVLGQNYLCVQGVNFKSALLTDSSLIQQVVTAAQE